MSGELSIQSLGRLEIRLGGDTLTKQLPAKAQGLLVYLSSTRRPHSRGTLAGLLWAQLGEDAARANLRLVLSRLRTVVGDALLITRQSVALDLNYPHRFDVAEFDELTDATDALTDEELCQVVALYRGPFLDDFQLRDAPDFELWLTGERERLQRQAIATHFVRATRFQQVGQFPEAIAAARHILEVEPWLEEAHQFLMRVLALAGQRSAALAHYEICRQVMAEELGVEPSVATIALYESIRDETVTGHESQMDSRNEQKLPVTHHPNPPPDSSSSPLLTAASRGAVKPPIFVARENELASLTSALARAKSGAGNPCFVLGDAGDGKSSLLKEFARQAQTTDGELIVAWGNCNAHTGIGEPYTPFREILFLLTGDVETYWPSELLTPEQVLRLWDLMPTALPLLVENAPELVGTFALGQGLLERAKSVAGADALWVQRLSELVPSIHPGRLEQPQIVSQFISFFKSLSAVQPLVLLLENLHWADASSLSLLFALCHQLQNSSILLVATYRPEEVDGRSGAEAQALQELVGECKRLYGDIIVDLGQMDAAAEQHFVRAYLQSQPNRFGTHFADGLLRQTEGHPLFTVELMRDLHEQGMIGQDDAGIWQEIGTVDWQRLPARVEGVIEMRISRLDAELQAFLAVAAVEGTSFTAEVLAQVLGVNTYTVIQRLSRELDRQHRLIIVQALESLNGQRLSRYRFRHQLIQYYLYQRLDAVERAYLHETVGNALAGLYGSETIKAAALARHFELAGLPARALEYLAIAGENAAHLSAHTEATTHFQQGLLLLASQPDDSSQHANKLRLQLGLCHALQVTKGYAAPEVEAAYQEAYALCEAVGETSAIFSVYYGLWSFFHVRSQHERGRALGEQWLQQAHAQGDVVPLLTGHRAMGVSLLHLGALTTARTHLEECLRLYRSDEHGTLALRFGADPGAAGEVLLAWTLWLLEERAAAMQHCQSAITLATSIDHPFTLAFVNVHAAMLHLFADDVAAARALTADALDICHKHGYPFWQTVGLCLEGYLHFREGTVTAGIAQMESALDAYQAMGAELWRPWMLGLLANAFEQSGQLASAHRVRQQARALAAKTGEQILAVAYVIPRHTNSTRRKD